MQYHAIIMKKAHQFINELLTRPHDFGDHIRQYPGSISMSIAYGYEVASHNDHFVKMAEQSVEMLNGTIFPGAAAINALPILQYLPDWLPGMGFKYYARRCKKLTIEMKNAPFQFVEDRMESGFLTTCVATELISQLSDRHGRMSIKIEEVVKDICMITYAARAETTASAIQTGFLAMVLYPEVRRKAQSEIDAVIGNSRLPSFDDRKFLPYVDAFVWEILRWHPVTPLSLARAVYEDDIYEGSFIPKGATLLVNTWGIHHDEETYPEPSMFKPERFLEADGSLSDKYPIPVFGTGRRVCPGRHVADAAIWAAIALILAVFDVKKAKDKVGNDIDVPEVYNDGLTSQPSVIPVQRHTTQ
ncbi:cytochrome P450 [Neolentinus lepideus HHB14362 ss-1]|uniref:Cytochrome P450 n=1 Tax=Neolentinus lepideus HHB14362 ss-1 TaxID=1314782 RepID=A0A165PQR2_9AGAM|nr:cytochrome P450 [Neolentinus lepideus HHB14362 ss-1]